MSELLTRKILFFLYVAATNPLWSSIEIESKNILDPWQDQAVGKEAWQEKIDHLTQELSHVKNQHTFLQQQYAQLEKTKNRLQQKNQELKNLSVTGLSTLEQRVIELAQEGLQNDACLKKLNEENLKLKINLHNENNKYQELSKQAQEWTSKEAALTEQLTALSQEAYAKQQALEAQQNKNAATDSQTLAELQQTLNDKDTLIKTLIQQIRDLGEEILVIKQEEKVLGQIAVGQQCNNQALQSALNHQIASCRSDMENTKEKAITAILLERQELLSRLLEAQEVIEDKENKIARLNILVQTNRQARLDQMRTISDFEQAIVKLKQICQNQQDNILILQAQTIAPPDNTSAIIEQLRTELAEKATGIASLEKYILKLEEDKQQISNQLQILEDQKQYEIAAFKEELSRTVAQHSLDKNTEIENLKADFDLALKEKELKTEILLAQLRNLERSQLDALDQYQENADNQNQAFAGRLERKQAKMRELKEKLQDQQIENQRLLHQMIQPQAEKISPDNDNHLTQDNKSASTECPTCALFLAQHDQDNAYTLTLAAKLEQAQQEILALQQNHDQSMQLTTKQLNWRSKVEQAELQNKLNDLEAKLNYSIEESRNLRQKLATLRQEKEHYQNNEEALLVTLRKLQNEHQAITAAIGELETDKQQKDLTNEEQQLLITSLQNRITNISDEFDTIKQSYAQTKAKVVELSEKIWQQQDRIKEEHQSVMAERIKQIELAESLKHSKSTHQWHAEKTSRELDKQTQAQHQLLQDNATLQTEIAQLTQAIADQQLNKQNQENLTDQNQQLFEQLERQQVKMRALKEKLQDQQIENQRLVQQITQAQPEIITPLKDLESPPAAACSTCSLLLAQHDQDNAYTHTLAAKLEQAQQEILALQQNHDQSMQLTTKQLNWRSKIEQAELQNKLNDLEAKLNYSIEESRNLRQKLATLRQEKEHYQNNEEALLATLRKLQSEHQAITSAIGELETDKQQKDLTNEEQLLLITSLQNRIANISDEFDTIKQSYAQTKAKVVELSEKIWQQQARIKEEHQSVMAERIKQIELAESLKHSKSTHQWHAEKSNRELEKQTQAQQQLLEDNAALQAEIAQLSQAIEALDLDKHQAIEKVQAEKNALNTKLQELNKRLIQTQEESWQANQRVNRLYEQTYQAKDELKSKENMYKKQLNSQLAALQALQDSHANLDNQLAITQKKLDHLTNENIRLTNLADNALHDLDTWKNKALIAEEKEIQNNWQTNWTKAITPSQEAVQTDHALWELSKIPLSSLIAQRAFISPQLKTALAQPQTLEKLVAQAKDLSQSLTQEIRTSKFNQQQPAQQLELKLSRNEELKTCNNIYKAFLALQQEFPISAQKTHIAELWQDYTSAMSNYLDCPEINGLPKEKAFSQNSELALKLNQLV